MSLIRSFSRLTSTLILCVGWFFLPACTLFKTVTIDPQGRKETKYFQNEWDLFKFSVDHDVELESSGQKPPGQRQSWQDWWDSRMLAIRQNNENPDRKINYIHESRKRAGLSLLQK